VLLDHRLDRLGAGVGGLLAHQRRRRAEREAGRAPQRRHQRRPHLAFGQDLVEGGQMLGLVRLHLLQLPGDAVLAGRAVQHRPLAAIDVHGGQLAGVIDPQHLRQPRLARAWARPAG